MAAPGRYPVPGPAGVSQGAPGGPPGGPGMGMASAQQVPPRYPSAGPGSNQQPIVRGPPFYPQGSQVPGGNPPRGGPMPLRGSQFPYGGKRMFVPSSMQMRRPMSGARKGAGGGPPGTGRMGVKKKRLGDRVLPSVIRDLVPESQAYMDLLNFERKLDATIMRKRLEIQEGLKRPHKVKRKLRVFISNTFFPGAAGGGGDASSGSEQPAAGQSSGPPCWELRVEGRLVEDDSIARWEAQHYPQGHKPKRKFSSFFKSLVIELDKELYGPDNHLVEWHRTQSTQETDGFQVKRPGDRNVRCTVLLLLDYNPPQYKLEPRLARLLGLHTSTRNNIIGAIWQYIKTHRLQDENENEYIACDRYLGAVFGCERMKFAEVPQRLHPLLYPPDPIVISHLVTVDSTEKKTVCYDIDVEVDDPLRQQMTAFLMNTNNQPDIASLDNKIHETVDAINNLKVHREFFLSLSEEPQEFTRRWVQSQSADLATMRDDTRQPEAERRGDFYDGAWVQEGVSRYFYTKIHQRRLELDNVLVGSRA